ncbi:MAG: hypothetical protein JWP11_1990 [Frankiales bacterium]|nr:hypothetical protein [Frankiales bacterium]
MSNSPVPSAYAGPLALLIVLLMGVALVLLIRNMNGRLRRLPPSFDPPPAPEQETDPGNPSPPHGS